MASDNDIQLAELTMLSHNNAKAIEALAKTVDKLAQTMVAEDKAIHETIIELKAARLDCEKRYNEFVVVIQRKADKIDDLRTLLQHKADLKELEELKNFLIKVWWTISLALASIVGTTIWNTVKG